MGAERPHRHDRPSSCRINGRKGVSRFRARSATTARGAGRRPRATARRRSPDSTLRRSPSRAPSAWPATTTSPRAWGGAWDVFGTGKTALKANVGKYLQNATNDENYTANNPAARIVRNVLNRGWVDNGNFVVDCDLRNPALQDNRASGGDQCAAVDRGQRELRERQSQPDGRQPGDSRGLGRASARLAVGRVGPAGTAPAAVGRRQLQPALVPELLRRRQPARLVRPTTRRGPTPRRFIADLPGRRRLPGHDVFPSCGHRRADVSDVRDRLSARRARSTGTA